MSQHTRPVRSMVVDGTGTEPKLRIAFNDGTHLELDASELQRFASDLVDWSYLFNDLGKAEQL
jgi:hypothetical protein